MNHTDLTTDSHLTATTPSKLSSGAPTTEATNERLNKLSNQPGLHEPTRET